MLQVIALEQTKQTNKKAFWFPKTDKVKWLRHAECGEGNELTILGSWFLFQDSALLVFIERKMTQPHVSPVADSWIDMPRGMAG